MSNKWKGKTMKTEYRSPVASGTDTIATLERPAQVNEVTRAILAGETAQVGEGRPHILARRNARWARRSAHG